jgi:hypothetical protein
LIRRVLPRLALASVLVLGFAGEAWAETKLLPLDKVFPYLQGYLQLPQAERSRFSLDYRLKGDAKALQTVRTALVEGGRTVPLPVSADGRFARLPTLEELRGKAQFSIEAEKVSGMGMLLSAAPTARPAREMDAAELAAALVQARAGEQKLAGVLAFAMPRLTRVAFEGVTSGEAVGADGRALPLPLAKGRPVFDPATLKGAKIVRFPAAPTRLELISAD